MGSYDKETDFYEIGKLAEGNSIPYSVCTDTEVREMTFHSLYALIICLPNERNGMLRETMK